MKKIICVFLIAVNTIGYSQNIPIKEKDGVKVYLNSDSSVFLKMTGTIQVWMRYSQNNPGSGLQFPSNSTFYAQPETFDVGIRRARFQLFGPLNKRLFFYTQFGLNNFTYLSTRKQGAFFHDLLGELNVVPRSLSLGSGLTGWSGLARYASPSVASTLLYDAPLYQQATNDISDQFLRKLSVYAKGKLSKLDYRVALSKPMPVQLASTPTDTSLNAQYNEISVFAPEPGKWQNQAYLSWQFLDEENNQIPYNVGTYLGKKRVFNLGAGIIQQSQAMRHKDQNQQLVHSDMLLWSADAFLDYALDREKQNAVTVYACYSNYNFGPNYIRSLGVMNPVNASNNPTVAKFSGTGNGYAMFGTGNIIYLQSGYLFRKDLLGSWGTLQVCGDATVADYQAFNDLMIVWNAGLNWYIKGHGSKLSLNYQNRPVFALNNQSYTGSELKGERKGMLVLQLQAAF